MAKVTNTGFFQKGKAPRQANASLNTKAPVDQPSMSSDIQISEQLIASLGDTVKALELNGRRNAAAEVRKICNSGLRNRFSIAVVGEFSRGKSTFLNALLGRNLLPTGDMPTTALLTRIRYSAKEGLIHFNEKNQKQAMLPITEESWEGLIADNFGKNDPSGTILMGVDDPWLRHANIELMDTPGAGDLEDKRAQIIGDVLYGCDGAIITVSATAPLSLSEKLFIEQRLIARKTPFLMLVVTKLDCIKPEERAGMIEYIEEKLTSWGMNIPVFIPYEVEMEGDRFQSMMGLEPIRREILSWLNNPERLSRTEAWLRGQAISVLEREISALQEQELLGEADAQSRSNLINEKKLKLKEAEIFWEDLGLRLLERCNKCYEKLQDKTNECATTITERLQYEASHSNNPSKWWKEDYPYRLKVELTNMASGVEHVVSRVVADDIRWFNLSLEQNFKTHVLSEQETIYDKELVTDAIHVRELTFDNLDKKRNIAKISTTVASIAGAALMLSSGGLALVATMGIGTGASILTEGFFKKKIEAQREKIKVTLAQEVPHMVSEATAGSEARLKAIYNSILADAKEKEAAWMHAQLEAIESSLQMENTGKARQWADQIKALEAQKCALMSI